MCLLSQVMVGFVQPKLESVVDGEEKIKHSELSSLTEDCIADPSKVGNSQCVCICIGKSKFPFISILENLIVGNFPK